MACTGTSAFVLRGGAIVATLLLTLACNSKPPTNDQSQPAGAQKLSEPSGVAVSNDGRRVYVATGRGNTVVVFDAASYRPAATIPVGQRVWGLALTPDGKKLYAADSLSNEVSVIDAAADRVVKTIKAGDGPWGIAIARR